MAARIMVEPRRHVAVSGGSGSEAAVARMEIFDAMCERPCLRALRGTPNGHVWMGNQHLGAVGWMPRTRAAYSFPRSEIVEAAG